MLQAKRTAHRGAFSSGLFPPGALPAIVFGIRIWASVSLALLTAYWLQLDNAYWAGTSASIVAQPGLGASLRKGRFRAIGTVAGAVAIVLMVALIPQNHLALLVTLTVWCATCGFLASVLPHFAGYSAALAGYTAAIIFSNIIPLPEGVFSVAVDRTLEIGIGIFSAGLVHALTDMGDARARLAGALAGIGTGIAQGVARTLSAGQETPALQIMRRELIGQIIAVDATIEEALGEPSPLRHRPTGVYAAVEGLFSALSAWRCLANHLAIVGSASVDAQPRDLMGAMDAIAERDWLKVPDKVRELCAAGHERIDEVRAAGCSSQLVVDSVAAALGALERVSNGLVFILTPDAARSDSVGKQHRVADLLPALVNAIRVLFALAAAETFWVLTEWQDGPAMITFTAIAIILFSPRAEQAYASVADYAAGTAIAAILAVSLNLLVFPALHGGFIWQSWVLALVLIPCGALSARRWHNLAFSAVVTNLVPILALENDPVYEGTTVVNTALAITAGTVVAMLFVRLIPPLSPGERVRRLLALTLSDLRRLVTRRRVYRRDEWLAVVAARLTVMPERATVDEQTRLLAALSTGEAANTLLGSRGHLSSWARDELDRAFESLAQGNVTTAGVELRRFGAGLFPGPPAAPSLPQRQAAVAATLVADSLERHPEYFCGLEYARD